MNIEVNFLAVLLASFASMVLGFLWYGPIVGKQWMKLKGYTAKSLKKDQSQMGKYYSISFVVALMTAFVLSHVMQLSQAAYNYPIMTTGMTTALWMWLGFVMPVQVTATIFGDKKWSLFAIDTGYQLFSLMVMGGVLALF